jgi:tetratricopeptide (TPR) repeat protein
MTGGSREAIGRHTLAIDQACGVELEAVLTARRRIAAASGQLEDLVPLGAVLADLERFDEADVTYRQAFYMYDDVSRFPLAWVCFQLGMLWGELVPAPDADRAALWYRHAITYLPGPEVRWRLADALMAQKRFEEGKRYLETARIGFEALPRKHLLAFADHAAEFYAGSGNDCRRALALARVNAANRPTRRATRQVHAIADRIEERSHD